MVNHRLVGFLHGGFVYLDFFTVVCHQAIHFDDFKHILWDHLAIMADFKLDIDYPYEIVKKENLYARPPRIPYNNNRIRYRHYGKTLELMIRKATELEAGVEKDQLIKLLATQMKKSFLTWNKESVDDRKIFKDLDELSSGKIVLDEEVHKLAPLLRRKSSVFR